MLIYTIDRRRAGRRKEQVGRFVEIAVELCNAGLEDDDTLPVKTLFVALDDAIGDILEPFRGQHIRARLLAGTAGVTRTAVILFFCANDGMSIVENLGIMGVPMPPALKDAFAVLRQKSSGEETAADETE